MSKGQTSFIWENVKILLSSSMSDTVKRQKPDNGNRESAKIRTQFYLYCRLQNFVSNNRTQSFITQPRSASQDLLQFYS